MNKEKEIGLKASAFAALALAFASFGDAFLYPFLPLNFETVRIPALWVGLILSINRFVRILSNALMVHAFSKYGLRSVMLIAVVLAITSTFGYGLAAGVLSWVLLRVLWGLAFSAMRIGTPGSAARSSHSLAAIAENATWRDIGAAIGTLLGGALISSQYLSAVLTIAVLIMVSLLMTHLGKTRRALKLFYLWK